MHRSAEEHRRRRVSLHPFSILNGSDDRSTSSASDTRSLHRSCKWLNQPTSAAQGTRNEISPRLHYLQLGCLPALADGARRAASSHGGYVGSEKLRPHDRMKLSRLRAGWRWCPYGHHSGWRWHLGNSCWIARAILRQLHHPQSKRAARHLPPIQLKDVTGWGAVRYCHHTPRPSACSRILEFALESLTC